MANFGCPLSGKYSYYLSMAQVVEDGAEVLGISVYEKGTALVLKTKRAAVLK
jgi:hypothetical protein